MPIHRKRRPAPSRHRNGFDRLESRIALSGFYVSTAGDDSAAGTVDAPWRTVGHAVESAAQGDVINLRAGTYAGGITVDKPDITIQSFPGERASIVASPYDSTITNNLWFKATGGKALNLDLRGGYYYGVKFEKGNGLVDGSKVTDTGYYGIKIVPGADHVTISRTEVGNTGLVHGGGGIDNVNGDYVTIRDCYIHNTRSDAIMVKGGAFGAVIERNRIENSTGTGIDGGQWTDSVWFDTTQNPERYEIVEPIIRNNIVIGTDYAGIALYGALRPEVSNNTLINTARVGQGSIYIASVQRFATNVDPKIINNIITRTVSGSRPMVFITVDGFTGTLTMDHNSYDNAGSDTLFWSQRAGHEFYGNFALWQATVGLDAASSQGDPGVDSKGRIMAGSRSIDVGRTLSRVVDDIDREPRTGAYDIGADEYPAPLQALPSAPANLSASGSSGRIALSWVGSAGAASYLVERSPDGAATWAQVGAAQAGVTTWQDAGLPAATSYRYRVRALNAAGLSPYSNTAAATTASDVVTPGGTLFADRFDTSGLGGAWSTVGGNWTQVGGVLRQSGLGAGDPKKASVTGVAFPADVEVTTRVRVDSWAGGDYARAGVSLGGDSSGRGYNLVFHADTNTVQFLHDHVAWGNRYAFSWQVGTWYWFTLRQEAGVLYGKVWADGEAEPSGWMFRQDGWGARSGSAGLNGGAYAASTASFDDFSVSTFTATSGLPSAPANLSASGSSGRIALSWVGSAGAASYLVERSPDGAATWAQVGAAQAGVTTWQDAGLPAATSYRYRVRALNAAGLSPYSNTAAATTASDVVTPGGTLFADRFDTSGLGGAWSTVGGNWTQVGGVLRQSGLGAGDPKKASVTGVAFPADVEVTTRVRVDSWAGGDYARAGVSLGGDSSGRGYNLVFHADTNTVQFLHDHVAWGNRYAFSWRVGTWYWFTLRQEAGVLYGKVWADGEAEPSGWMFRQDGWGARSGSAGLNGGAYAASTASFDDFSVST